MLEYDHPLTSQTATGVYGQAGSFTTHVANNGGLSASSLDAPAGLAVDAADDLYVADYFNNRVLQFGTPTIRAVQEYQPNVPWNGRFESVDVNPFHVDQLVAASDNGGLFNSEDGGLTWHHLDGLPVHAFSDVAYSPAIDGVILATSWGDGKIASRDGIWRSTDNGATWSQAAWSPSCNGREGWGITVQAGSGDVFVGTDCGVEVSHDSGLTWTAAVDENGAPLERTSSVTTNGGGIVDTCGESPTGTQPAVHRRSIDDGAHFGPATTVGGQYACSFAHGQLAASPWESSVLFAGVSSSELDESDDGGASWHQVPSPGPAPGRPQFVRTRQSVDGVPGHFDLYWGSGHAGIVRETCVSGGPGPRCTGASWTSIDFNHFGEDPSWFVFDLTDNCPDFFSSDGGLARAEGCGTSPAMMVGAGPGGLDALELYDVAGQIHPAATDVYFGTQDNFDWSSADNGVTWTAGASADEGGGATLPRLTPASTDMALYPCTGCLFFDVPFRYTAHMQQQLAWTSPGANAGWPMVIGPNLWVQTAGTAVYWSNDDAYTWHQAPGIVLPGPNTWFPSVAGPPADPTIFIPVSGTLVRIRGIFTGSPTMTTEDASTGLIHLARFRTVAVDPNDPNHLFAIDDGDGTIKVSTNGGQTWSADTWLMNLTSQNGTLLFELGRNGPEVHTIAFDPVDGRRILVGTEDAGIIESIDGGTTWFVVPGTEEVPSVGAFFFDEVRGDILVSSFGRGLWKMSYPPPTCGDPDGNGDVDFCNSGANMPCVQDHIGDANNDGYSDSDEFTPVGAPTCTGAYSAGGGLGHANVNAPCLGRNLLGTPAQATAAKIAKADVDVNGRVNILDLSAATGVYNQSGFGSDPNDRRNEFDQDGNGLINILDLARMAGQYNKLVPPC